jgi:hypothetical protein
LVAAVNIYYFVIIFVFEALIVIFALVIIAVELEK